MKVPRCEINFKINSNSVNFNRNKDEFVYLINILKQNSYYNLDIYHCVKYIVVSRRKIIVCNSQEWLIFALVRSGTPLRAVPELSYSKMRFLLCSLHNILFSVSSD